MFRCALRRGVDRGLLREATVVSGGDDTLQDESGWSDLCPLAAHEAARCVEDDDEALEAKKD